MVNPRTFFNFSVDDQPVGRVIFELFVDSTPKTCENFRALCTGDKGLSASGSPLYYKKSILHRCIKDFMLQGGDFIKGNGMGGESIYGSSFADEDLTIPLDSEGLLCMANKGPNTNGSQFFITLRPCPHLNGKHVVFGRVVKGYDDVIKQLANISVDEKHRPTTPIVISNCGELELRKSIKRPRSKDVIQQKDSSRSRSTSPNSKRRSIRPKKSHKLDKPDVTTETEEEYDARLEREEKERLEAQRREALQRIKAKCEQDSQSTDGIRFKGRGRMKFIDPEIGQQRP